MPALPFPLRSQMAEAARASTVQMQKSRAFWLKHLHQWHWVSAAACLIGLLLFSLTGFTLNHATAIASKPEVTTKTGQLPPDLLNELNTRADAGTDAKPELPADLVRYLREEFAARVSAENAEWSDDEVYFSLPRPGGDAWLTIELAGGEVTHEITRRGWISYLNDLHKGRNTGGAWSLFIDVFAFAVLIFAITGLLLLKMHSTHRPATWPMVALGLALPLVLAILFVH